MGSFIDIDELFHRSRERIRDLGEVFTPESCVVDMLKLVSRDNKDLWSDETISFFEPCCGHGNIVAAIYKKRLAGLYKKAFSQGHKIPALYAVANAINTLWAIDIDYKNVTHCKSRVLWCTLEFLKEKTEISNDSLVIFQHSEFFAHILCAINWHIQENETLSSLSGTNTASENAGKTQLGNRWYSQNGHHPIDFDSSWAGHFETCLADNLVPLDFKRSKRFIKNILAGNARGYSEFKFADFLVPKLRAAIKLSTRVEDFATG